MRIRSIKPEFWTSEDIAVLPWDVRLLFIGLWSYVDDNGVGRDVEKLIAADLFPLEEDPRDTLSTVSRGLQKLFQRGQIVRYAVEGRPYLYVANWDKHQKIDHPAKPRYPLPTRDDAQIREPVATLSRIHREPVAPGTGEQGNRGTGEQTPSSADADAVFDRFWSLYPKKVDKQAAKRKWDSTVKRVDPEEIIEGLTRYVAYWDRKRTERQFIKGPEVWLNKGCWADELDDGAESSEGWGFPGA